MKLSKEIKTGLLVSISVLIFFAGFYFLKGANIFSSQNKYYCFFDKVDGLQVSAAVQVRGMSVGRVSDIELVDNKGVKVTITVDKDVNVTKGVEAKLASADLITGTKVIKLILSDNTEALAKGSDIPASIEKTFLDNIGDDVSPVVTTAKRVMAELDSVVVSVKDIVNDRNKQAIANSVASIEATTNNIAILSGKLRNQSERIEHILVNADTLTRNMSKASKEVANAPIKQTVEEMQGTIAQLREVVNKINSGDGSLGKLVNDKELYNNLNNSLNSLDKLMTDLKAHPSRYINLTIFGRKNKE